MEPVEHHDQAFQHFQCQAIPKMAASKAKEYERVQEYERMERVYWKPLCKSQTNQWFLWFSNVFHLVSLDVFLCLQNIVSTCFQHFTEENGKGMTKQVQYFSPSGGHPTSWLDFQSFESPSNSFNKFHLGPAKEPAASCKNLATWMFSKKDPKYPNEIYNKKMLYLYLRHVFHQLKKMAGALKKYILYIVKCDYI